MSDDKDQLLIISGSTEAEEMKLRLAESDFNAVTIVNYSNALPVIRSVLPDLILLAKQSGHSSLSLINKIHRQFPLVPIVMVATNIEEEAMREHLEAGAVGVHAHDRSKSAILLQADIAGRTHGNV